MDSKQGNTDTTTPTQDAQESPSPQTEHEVLPKAEHDSRALKIRTIVVHCTAGFAPAKAVQEYFTRPKNKGGRGWSKGGYHRIINRDGSIHKMYDFGTLTNGVKGFNAETIHIAYVGGIEKAKTGRYIAKDTRNNAQKESITECVEEALKWIHENGGDLTDDIQVAGHRDFSHDKNKDNVIQSWERIKECPSFNAIIEYQGYSSKDRIGTLPTKK